MIKPFADDDATSSIGGLSIENGTGKVLLSGSIEITCDRTGLARAKELKLFADRIIEELEARGPSHATDQSEAVSVDQVKNPFA